MRNVLLLSLIFAFVFATTAGAADISGNWAIKMKNPMGEDEPFTVTITADGENLKITSSDHPKFQNLEGSGTLKGNAITMSLKASGDMPIEFKFDGTVSGKKMTVAMSQGGAPGGEGGGAPGGEGGGAPGGERGSAASAESGGPGGAQGEVSNVFTAEKM